MGLDQAGQDDHLSRVDRRRAGGGKAGPHGDDRAVAHVYVAPRQVAERRIHGQDVAAAHHDLAARRKLRRGAVLHPAATAAPSVRRGRRGVHLARHPRQARGADGGGRTQQAAPTDPALTAHGRILSSALPN